MTRLLALMLSTLATAAGASGLALPLAPQPVQVMQGMPGEGDALVPDDGRRRSDRRVDRRVVREPRQVGRQGLRSRRNVREADTPPARPADRLPVEARPDDPAWH